jgi:hypothetical protein
MENRDLFLENISKLKKSPVFSMSLGSKELFHSNFWAFLMEHKDYRLLLYSLFPELEASEPVQIKREYKNRDIVIIYKGKEFVIENKIKSYPDLGQLKRYGEDPNMALGIVTGINRPPFDLPEKWKYVSYSSIAKILRDVITNDKYLKSIVDDYCDVLDSINELMKLSLDETKGRLSYWSDDIKKLYDVRLMDVFRKIKADDFVQTCEELRILAEHEIKDLQEWTFYISRSFHNGKSTISFELQRGSGENYKGQIGIQIEDNQFRFFLGLRSGTVKEIFKIGLDENWFDDSFDKKNHRMVFNHPTTMRKNPCSYSGHWVYQYFDTWNDKIEPNVDIQSYEKIKEQVKYYLERAICIVRSKGDSIFK